MKNFGVLLLFLSILNCEKIEPKKPVIDNAENEIKRNTINQNENNLSQIIFGKYDCDNGAFFEIKEGEGVSFYIEDCPEDGLLEGAYEATTEYTGIRFFTSDRSYSFKALGKGHLKLIEGHAGICNRSTSLKTGADCKIKTIYSP